MSDKYVKPGRVAALGVSLTGGVETKWDDSTRSLHLTLKDRQMIIPLPEGLELEITAENITVKGLSSYPKAKALSGTLTAIIRNAVQGLVKDWEIKLTVQGIGYKIMPAEKNQVKFLLGYSQPKIFEIDPAISFEIVDNNQGLIIKCHDKQLLGKCASEMYKLRVPDPYKGKGVIYMGKMHKKFKRKEVGK